MTMTLSEYLAAGGRGALVRLSASICAHAPDVSRWARKKRPVPEKSATAIEQATAGAVTRRELRPNDWYRIWPELVTPETPAPSAAAPASKEPSHG